MLKKYLLAIAFISSTCYGYAQSDSLRFKKTNHYIGIQANPLFRQIINLNNNNTNLITNPYLVTYSVVSARTGWGVFTGFGYNYQSIKDKDAPENRQTKVNNVSARVGFGRKVALSKKFEAEFSFDVAGDYKNDKTFSLSVTDFGSGFSDSVSTTVSTKAKSIGGGLRGGLNFYITPRILLGTEANYYFLYSPQRQNVAIKETITQQGFSSNTTYTHHNESVNTAKFSLTLPAVLFIMVKF